MRSKELQDPIYKNPAIEISKRVEDLLGRMTVEEKVGQMVQLDGRKGLEDNLKAQHAGSFLQIMGEDCTKAILAARKTRLGIPLLLAVDAIHGHSFWEGATIFPTQLGCASAWNEQITEKMGEVTAKEMRYTGVSWTFAPVFCIARDLRWGRVGETFGEDPFLLGKLGSAMIRGLQGSELGNNPNKVLACAKHFAGYSETQGGLDASEADTSPRKLRSYFLPPFHEACKAKVGSFMTGYQSMEGRPSSANKFLLRGILKEEWGFDGFVVTDWNNVGSLVQNQKVCANYEDAAILAVESGNDMMMSTPEFYQGCMDAIKHNRLDMSLVDDSVRRILTVKFKLGLFEDDRISNLDKAVGRVAIAEHRNAALQAARESAILLKNNGLLPLKERKIKKLAVIGPNADDLVATCGDWSRGTGQAGAKDPHPRACYITSLDGIKKRFKGELMYEPGATIVDGDKANFATAMRYVNSADTVVAIVGDRQKYWGEWASTATLELMGDQQYLLDRIVDSGKPLVVVVISSKPLIIPERVRNHADAIIQQFSPGMLGGQALAEILFGDIAPEGRLPLTMVRHVGQQPSYYNRVRGRHGGYADMTLEPAYPFGYGLTYTTFEYESAKLVNDTLKKTDTLKADVVIKNSGKRAGAEVIQAYISDLVTSATWATVELKNFAKVRLNPGESRKVTIEIPVSACSIINADGVRLVESGDFELQIGASASDIKFVLPFTVK